MEDLGSIPAFGRFPWRRAWQPIPVLLLPVESHGQRSLVGYSPRGRKELDTTEWLSTAQQGASVVSDQLFEILWTIACQAALSMGFSRQYRSGLPFPSPGDLPNPEIEAGSPAFQADALTSEPPGKSSNRILLFSVKHQHESAIDIHISPPF